MLLLSLSIVGNYDKFNRKQFHLQFIQEEVKLSIESNEWEDMESEFFDLLKDEITRYNIKLLPDLPLELDFLFFPIYQ